MRDPSRLAKCRTSVACAIGVALVTVAGCVGGPKTPTVDILDPIPPGVSVAAAAAAPCKEDEAGFNFRFVVMTPADLSTASPLLALFRERGFYRTTVSDEDFPWVRARYQHNKLQVRLEAGPLDRYLADPKPHQGPPPESLPQIVRDHPTQYELIALRPTDFACNTPP